MVSGPPSFASTMNRIILVKEVKGVTLSGYIVAGPESSKNVKVNVKF